MEFATKFKVGDQVVVDGTSGEFKPGHGVIEAIKGVSTIMYRVRMANTPFKSFTQMVYEDYLERIHLKSLLRVSFSDDELDYESYVTKLEFPIEDNYKVIYVYDQGQLLATFEDEDFSIAQKLLDMHCNAVFQRTIDIEAYNSAMTVYKNEVDILMAKFWKDSFKALSLDYGANYAPKLRALVHKYAEFDEKNTVQLMLKAFFKTLKELSQLISN